MSAKLIHQMLQAADCLRQIPDVETVKKLLNDALDFCCTEQLDLKNQIECALQLLNNNSDNKQKQQMKTPKELAEWVEEYARLVKQRQKLCPKNKNMSNDAENLRKAAKYLRQIKSNP